MSSPAPSVPLPPAGAPERSAVVDLAAVRANVRRAREVAAPARLMAVVKADAYGHGAVPVARAALAAGADALGVAHVAEALQLRAAGVDAPLLAWLHTVGTDFRAGLAAGVELGVSGWELAPIAEAARALGTTARIHLKIDTGLGRNGATEAAWPGLVRAAAAAEAEGLVEVVGIFTHLAVADEPERPETAQQLARFRAAVDAARAAGLRPATRHAANSPGLFTARDQERPEDMLLDMVRVGVCLYGLSPFADRTPEELGLVPAMTLRTTVSAVKEVPAGQGVSYGLAHVTDRPTTLALVPLGYADGVPRAATGGPVRIQGRTCPVVGRVAMDQVVVDLGAPGLAAPEHGLLGAEAVLFGAGENPSATAWAEAAGTINYEIVTRVSPRVPRVHVDGAPAGAGKEAP
ncbi:alanine racemase [Kocuria flava]|uniref:Alanine racemase n=1 Tax=Kocuria flava TaxID=446860 RepID=A0A0U3GKD6_9MICC|nr:MULTISPECIES: alanine racemase [Kocuria]ALU40638.1 alanine racemase [Kocuria flava]MCD1146417.1 alanine racemase [Kocuria sp. LUK]PLC12328.1 alanine racemase [Kocuria flava]GEO92624.1 alanine racemase [Kocuria flava]